MELDKLKKSWGELNKKVNESEVIEQEEIIALLGKKKKSNLQLLIRLELGVVILLASILLMVLYAFFKYNTIPPSILCVVSTPLLCGIAIGAFSYCKLKQASNTNNSLEMQTQYTCEYKQLVVIGYVIGYLVVIPIMACFFYQQRNNTGFVIGLALALLAAICIDVFLYKTVTKKVIGISQANKELREIKEMMREEKKEEV